MNDPTTHYVTYEFYRVCAFEAGALTDREVQAELQKVPASAPFPIDTYYNNDYLLYEIHSKGNYVYGTILVSRMGEIPGKFNRQTQQVTALDLTDDEGLEDHATFLIDLNSNILVIERGRVSASTFLHYLNRSGLQKMTISLIFKDDPKRKFNKMKKFFKMSVHMADVTGFGNLPGGILSSNSLFKAANESGAREVTFSFKADIGVRKNRSLGLQWLKDVTDEFLKIQGVEVISLKVGGEYPTDGGSIAYDLIDLISEKLTEKTSYTKPPRDPSIQYLNDKYKSLVNMYNAHAPNLTKAHRVK